MACENGSGAIASITAVSIGESECFMSPHYPSWPGFVPAIHVLPAQLLATKDVNARHRRQVYAVCAKQTAMAGHDELRRKAPFH
jgi:hypothetical protein